MFRLIRLLFSCFVVACGLYHINGLIAYDCRQGGVTSAAFSLVSVGDCPVVSSRIAKQEKVIQLLQATRYRHTPVHQCGVVLKTLVTYCGMHSHASVVGGGFKERVYAMNKDECLTMHKNRQWRYKDRSYPITLNGTTILDTVLAGSADANGNCHGGWYYDGTQDYSSVVVQATITVRMYNGMALYDLEKELISMPGGVACKITDDICIDDRVGYSYWTLDRGHDCDGRLYTVLYEGKSVFLTSNMNGTNRTVVTVESSESTFALEVVKPISLCHLVAFETEHPKLFIVLAGGPGYQFMFKKPDEIQGIDVNMATYYNSKFVYVERHIRTQLEAMYVYVMAEKCELEKKMLHNLLSIAYISPDEFAYALMRGPGYTALVRGEAVYVLKCVPTTAYGRSSPDHCYQEMPVTSNNVSLFMSPRNRILLKYGNEVECSDIYPVSYPVSQTWINLYPRIHEVQPIKELQVHNAKPWEELYSDPHRLADHGIVKLDPLENHQSELMLSGEMRSMSNIVARGFAGADIDPQTGRLTNLFTPDTLNYMFNDYMTRIWGFMVPFGTFCAGLMGITMCIWIGWTFLTVLVRGVVLYRVFGFSLKLFAALVGVLFTCVLAPIRRMADVVRPTPVVREEMPDPEAGAAENESDEIVNSGPAAAPRTAARRSDRSVMIYPNIAEEVELLPARASASR
jgi:hypothetical protein